jgi:WD40 repeat protein
MELEELLRLECHSDAVWDCRWHTSGRYGAQSSHQLCLAGGLLPHGRCTSSVLTASFDGTAMLHDVQGGRTLLTLRGHSDRVMGIHSLGQDEVSRAALAAVQVVHRSHTVGITAGGAWWGQVVTASRDGTIKHWDLRVSGSCIGTLADDRAQVQQTRQHMHFFFFLPCKIRHINDNCIPVQCVSYRKLSYMSLLTVNT